MTDSEISVHAHVHQCGICEQMSSSGVDLFSGRRSYYNFICSLCWQQHQALSEFRKTAAQIEQQKRIAAAV
jgi:hypothetical protein